MKTFKSVHAVVQFRSHPLSGRSLHGHTRAPAARAGSHAATVSALQVDYHESATIRSSQSPLSIINAMPSALNEIMKDHIRRRHAGRHPESADHNSPSQSGDIGPCVGERRVCSRQQTFKVAPCPDHSRFPSVRSLT